MSARIRFLIALENAIRTGTIKRFKQALDFARREFGEIDDNLFYKILDVFKKQGKTKKGDVVPIKKKEGIMATDEAAKIVKKRTDDIRKGDVTGETSDLMKDVEKKVKDIKKQADELKKVADDTKPFMEIAEGPQKGKKLTVDDFFAMTGAARDPRKGVVRAAAREILNKNKIKIGNEDPIEVLRKTYGEDALEAIDAVSDGLLDAQSYGEMNTILRDNKLFDIVPKKTYGYDQNVVAAEKIRKAKEQEAKNRQLLEEFDPKDRDPNAYGGIVGNLHLNRTGFDSGGTGNQKLREAMAQMIMTKVPGIPESDIQIIVKDINIGMSPSEAQASVKANFMKLYGYAEGGRVQAASGGLINILKL